MPAEFGHDSMNPAVQALLPPCAEKAATISLLREKSRLEASAGRLEWIGLATGCELSSRLVDGNLGVDLAWQSATIFGSGRETFCASTPSFLAALVSKLVDRWGEYKNRYLCLSGLSDVCFERVLEGLEMEMACEFEVGYLEREEGIREAHARIEKGWPDAGMFLLERCVLVDEECWTGFERDRAMLAELDIPKEELGAVLHGAVHQFKRHGKGGCGCN